MKKLLLCVSLLLAVLTVSTFAAETVIYENDFSNPATISDFAQYVQKWEIKNGGLYLTENFLPESPNKNLDTAFAHILYNGGENLTDYTVEVDYINVQTAGGIIFRSNSAAHTHNTSGFAGYLAFIANDANKGALGSATDEMVNESYKGNINVGKSGNCNIGSNIHIKVTVKGDKMHILMTNMENNKTVYDYTYTIGTNTNDFARTAGTFGLRMRAGYKNNNAYSAGEAYFDNLKVTTANELTISGGTTATTTPAANSTTSIDTSNLVKVYENTFDNAASIKDFAQFGGTWAVYGGQLYLSAKSSLSHPYILFGGADELVNLKDYVVDVDMYNIQTQGGIIIRSDYANIIENSESGFKGYHMFVSNNGTLGAIGAGNTDGKWLEGNIKVSSAIMQPGMNIHMRAAVKGDLIQITISDLASGKELWNWCQKYSLWSAGTFGFRLRGTEASGLNNLNTTSFDNLVISTYGEAKAKTEVKLTVGSTTGYINAVAQTLDAAPINRNNRVLLPVRFLANTFGVNNDGIKWDASTRTATLTNSDVTIVVTIDAPTMTVNGQSVALDAPAIIENNRTYLPLRAIANALGVSNDNIAWDGATSTATLVK